MSKIKTLSLEKLSHHVSGKWSVHQIIAHIITAERLSLNYLQKKSNAIHEVDDSGLWEELKMMMLVASQRLPGLKFKAPKVVVQNTPTDLDLASLQNEWDALRKELKEFLEKIPPGAEKRLIYKHVRAGRLNTIHALKFFREHIIHHTPQIKRLL
jgi:hypothetical protein